MQRQPVERVDEMRSGGLKPAAARHSFAIGTGNWAGSLRGLTFDRGGHRNDQVTWPASSLAYREGQLACLRR